MEVVTEPQSTSFLRVALPLQWATLRMERGAKEKNHQLYKPYTNGKTVSPSLS